jgi:hypothetical protein
MYDTSDDDDCADQRDERSPTERSQNVMRSPHLSLQRCLAWSQDDDLTDERVQGEEMENDERNIIPSMQHSESSINMVKSFGSFHSAVVDAASSADFHVASFGNNGIRPVHWEEQVTMDKRLEWFLPKNTSTTGQ